MYDIVNIEIICKQILKYNYKSFLKLIGKLVKIQCGPATVIKG